MLTLSQRERDRLVVLHQIRQRQLTVSEGARRLHLGLRRMRRLLRRFEREGDRVAMHGLRGRPSNHRASQRVRTAALAKARDPLYADFGPTLLAEHLERDGVRVKPATLRRWLIEAELWTPTLRGQRHRTRRERRSAPGELVLMDTSIHAWLEDRSPEPIVLLALIDDATSRLDARFFAKDTGAANRQMLVDHLGRYGRMGALYTDRASHFQSHFQRTRRQEEGKDEAHTLIQRALSALDIELILALSPQAKGRVERLFKTLQDRMVKELRVAGITTLEAANRFLQDVFIPFWNSHFTVEPAEATDAHRPLVEGTALLRLFAETEERTIKQDFTIRYRNEWWQIGAAEADPAMPGTRLVVEHHLDGAVVYRWRERALTLTPAGRADWPRPEPVRTEPARTEPVRSEPTSATPRTRPHPPRPGPDHPWKRNPLRVGKHDPKRRAAVVASASLRPDTPAVWNTAPIALPTPGG